MAASDEELDFLNTLPGINIVDTEASRIFLIEAEDAVIAKIREYSIGKGWAVDHERTYGEPRVL